MNTRNTRRITVKDVVVTGGLSFSILTVGFVSLEQDKYVVRHPSFIPNSYDQAPIGKPEYPLLYPYTDASTITLVTGVEYDTQFVKAERSASYSLPYHPVDTFLNNPPGYNNSPSYAIPGGVQLFKIDWENPEQVEYFSYNSDGVSPEIRPVRIYSRLRRA